ncbi:PIN domain-containing protein [Sorangium sp. So ce302]|uniref:PIN domain-containing protein n=1 Tax=unclassified Sorangium TaxID=2621164 RepID=UPI003F61BEFB
MKKLFPGSYPLKDEDFKVLWSEGMFVFDTNMLLNVYRYSEEARKEFLDLLSSPEVAPRIWIPYQVACEYHRNLDEVRYEQVRKCIDIKHQVEKWGQSSRAGDHRTRAEQLSALVNKFVEEADKDYRHPDREALIERIAGLFEGKVGPDWDQERLKKVYKQGEERYKDEIPPGFKDRQQKKGDEKYGDLVIWFQIIEEAKSRKKPVILVTDDVKEDWWLRIDGKTVGPLPALRNELHKEAEVILHMYSGDRFLEQARKMLHHPVREETVKEVRQVRQDQEKQQVSTDEILKKIFGETRGGAPARAALVPQSTPATPAIREAVARQLTNAKDLNLSEGEVAAAILGTLAALGVAVAASPPTRPLRRRRRIGVSSKE